jgi:hypothetical protein
MLIERVMLRPALPFFSNSNPITTISLHLNKITALICMINFILFFNFVYVFVFPLMLLFQFMGLNIRDAFNFAWRRRWIGALGVERDQNLSVVSEFMIDLVGLYHQIVKKLFCKCKT